MPAPLLTREEVIARLMAVFRKNGYNGTSIGDLSEATGLGRSSLYHYFPGGKEDMTRAVLEQAIRWMEDSVVKPLSGEGEPEVRVARMIATLSEFYDCGRRGCLLANLCVGESRFLFQGELAYIYRKWIDALTALLAEAGLPANVAKERAERTVMTIQGAVVLSAGLDDTGPFERAMASLYRDVFGEK